MRYKDIPRYAHLKSGKFGRAASIYPLMATFVKKKLTYFYQ